MTEASLPAIISPRPIGNLSNNSDPPSIGANVGNADNYQNHQYECIPEYLLTMTRRQQSSIRCHRQHQLYPRSNTCSIPYATFSRSLLLSRGVTTASTSDSSQCTCSPPPSAATVVQEESSTPLLPSSIRRETHQTGEILMPSTKSMIIGWTRRNPSISTKRKSMGNTDNEQRHSFLSHLRKSSVLQ